MLGANIFMPLIQATPAYADNSDLRLALSRRELQSFVFCISGDHSELKTNPNTSVYSGLFNSSSRNVVVGLDRTDYSVVNGVGDCPGLVTTGLSVLLGSPSAPLTLSPADLQLIFEQKLTGTDTAHLPIGGKLPTGSLIENANNLVAQAQAMIATIPTPSSGQKQARLLPLASMCYTFTTSPSHTTPGHDFKFDAGGSTEFAILKSNDDIKKESAFSNLIEDNSSSILGETIEHNAKIKGTDKQLGFTYKNTALHRADFSDFESGFFPLGDDLPDTAGQSILNCKFVFDNQALIFSGVTIGADGSLIGPNGTPIGPGTPPSQQPDSINGTNCSKAGSFGWIICPVVSAINNLLTKIYDGFVKPELEVQALSVTATPEIYKVWGSFRDLADGLFVLLFIIILFGNLLSIEFDAYTVKKALPRLVLAVIAVQLSFYIAAVIVDIGNVLGNGVAQLASIAGQSGSGSDVQQAASGLFSGVILGGGAAIATFLELWPLLIPLLLGMVISVATLIITLVIRHILINVLVILSPIAIIAWVLPNTETYFKKWLSNFIKAIMMFPLIALLLAVAGITAKVSSSSGPAAQVLGLFAPMIAFFMMPATFKASGALMGKVSGAVQARGHKYSTGLKQSPWAKNLKADQRNKLAGKEQLGGVKGFIAGAAQGRVFGSRTAGDKFRAARAFTSQSNEMKTRVGEAYTENDLVNAAKGMFNDNTKSLKGDATALAAVHSLVNEKGLYEPNMLGSLAKGSGLNEAQAQRALDYVRSGSGGAKMAETNVVMASANLDDYTFTGKGNGQYDAVFTGQAAPSDITRDNYGNITGYREGTRWHVMQSRYSTMSAAKTGQQKGHGWKDAANSGMVRYLSASAVTGQADEVVRNSTPDGNRRELAQAIMTAGDANVQRAVRATIDVGTGRLLQPPPGGTTPPAAPISAPVAPPAAPSTPPPGATPPPPGYTTRPSGLIVPPGNEDE